MLGTRKFFVDSFCEIKDFTKDYQDEEFCNFAEVEIVPGAVYAISRQQFAIHTELIKQLATTQTIIPVLANPAEGSSTMFYQMEHMGITDLVRAGRIVVMSGGDLPSDLPNIQLENFLPKILDYTENLQAINEYQTNWTTARPYKFLFLNGRARAHRRTLLARLELLLDQAIWTNLDNTHGNPIKLLEPKYEFDFYQKNTSITHNGFAKYDLFNNDWGEIYLNPCAYTDTYFSLVTETVFEYPYSFRTEKIWKPVAIGHPFVVVSNQGYYRDLHKLGFKTFGHLIDESFDLIDNNQERLERIALVVEDLCQQDLGSFITAAADVCKYNQQQLAELRPKIRSEFPARFYQYINEQY